MIRGTTPTHIFRLPFDSSLLSSARVVYKQGQREVLRKETEAFDMEENILRVTLSQEDTLRFDCKLSVKLQLRVKTKTGQVLAMKPRIVTVDECLDGEVLT
jgi:hypothetical protein